MRLTLDMMPLGKIKSATNNPKNHNIGALAESFRRYGFNDFPTINETTGRMVEGHGRVAALKLIKSKGEDPPKNVVAQGRQWLVPVVRGVAFENDNLAEEYLVAHNQHTISSGWKEVELARLLKTFDNPSAIALGFNDDTLKALINSNTEKTPKGGGNEDDEPEPPKKPITRVGDVWKLGKHRVICGEALVVAPREQFDVVFTDPPYGMGLDPYYAKLFNGTHQTGDRFDKVVGDDRPFNAAPLIELYDSAREQFWFGADYYRKTITDEGSWLVWDKRGDMPNLDLLAGAVFELCWSKVKHKREIARVLWSGHHGLQNEDTKQRVHPNQKPVKLFEFFNERYFRVGDRVIDFFSGAGFTLIGAEKFGLVCTAVELLPAYCDVMVERWQNFTGGKAERVGALPTRKRSSSGAKKKKKRSSGKNSKS